MLYLATPQTNAVACVMSHIGHPESDSPHVLSVVLVPSFLVREGTLALGLHGAPSGCTPPHGEGKEQEGLDACSEG